jgi:hypothetical protein
LAFDASTDPLYIASTGDNAIYTVEHASMATSDAGTGTVFIRDAAHLHGPLALVQATNSDLITSQGDAISPDPSRPSEIVEYRGALRGAALGSMRRLVQRLDLRWGPAITA